MKKVLFILVVAIVGLGNVNAQGSNFGITAGFHNLSLKLDVLGMTESESSQGFFVGVTSDFSLSDKFSLQPQLQFATSSQDGDSLEQLILPIMLKYHVTEKFNLQAGPQLDYVLSDSEGLNAIGFGLGFGAGFDFSEKIFVSTRYALGLSNRFEDAPSEISLKLNTFQIGLGYRF
ncbi:MAG: opacity protein-like surface antigen [Polaribacter sp.]|jgi:opacity protein-like surface antigen